MHLLLPVLSIVIQWCPSCFGGHIDDGFQYTLIEKDIDIVLINAINPFGNRHLFPSGVLREPMHVLRRANLMILSHMDLYSDGMQESKREESIYSLLSRNTLVRKLKPGNKKV